MPAAEERRERTDRVAPMERRDHLEMEDCLECLESPGRREKPESPVILAGRDLKETPDHRESSERAKEIKESVDSREWTECQDPRDLLVLMALEELWEIVE